MKYLTLFFIAISFLVNTQSLSAEKNRSLLEKLFNKDLPGGATYKEKKADKSLDQKSTSKEITRTCKKNSGRSLLEKVLRKDLPGGNARKNIKEKCSPSEKQVKLKKIKIVKIYLIITKQVKIFQFTQELLTSLMKKVMTKLA